MLIVPFTISKTKREIITDNIKKYTETLTKPDKADELFSSFNKLTLLFYTLTSKELDEVKIKYDLSDLLMTQIKVAQYVTSSAMKKVEEKNQLNYYSYEESLGSSLKENDGWICINKNKINC